MFVVVDVVANEAQVCESRLISVGLSHVLHGLGFSIFNIYGRGARSKVMIDHNCLVFTYPVVTPSCIYYGPVAAWLRAFPQSPAKALQEPEKSNFRDSVPLS